MPALYHRAVTLRSARAAERGAADQFGPGKQGAGNQSGGYNGADDSFSEKRSSESAELKCLDRITGLTRYGFKKKTTTELNLNNNSRIVALPGDPNNIRGFSGAYQVIVDEASRVPDEAYNAVRPIISASKGRLLLLSTPFGQRGFFYDRYKNEEKENV